jgi:hypothetical protein
MLGSSERFSKYFAHQDCTSAAKRSSVPQIFWFMACGGRNVGNTESGILSKFIFYVFCKFGCLYHFSLVEKLELVSL